jgi:hypothetical protein
MVYLLALEPKMLVLPEPVGHLRRASSERLSEATSLHPNYLSSTTQTRKRLGCIPCAVVTQHAGCPVCPSSTTPLHKKR